MACTNTNHLDVQGHRGCRGLLPENSLPAFEKAIELGVTTIEMDVVISKDKKVVVSHEPYMNHEIVLGPKGHPIPEVEETDFNLFEMTYDSIKTYDSGSKQHPRFPEQRSLKVYKPLLSEVISMAEKKSNKSIRYNIEIKNEPSYAGIFAPEVSEFVSLVVAQLKAFDIEDRTTLQSFDLATIEEINSRNLDISIAMLIDENESIDDILMKLSFKPKIVSPYYRLLSENSVKKLQNDGFKVIPWTVNSENEMKMMMAFGVDGIITDYPDRLIKLLQS